MGRDIHVSRVSSPIEARCERLVNKLRNVPMSYFTVEDLVSLSTLLIGPCVTGSRIICNEDDLKRLEKIAKDFKCKRGAR